MTKVTRPRRREMVCTRSESPYIRHMQRTRLARTFAVLFAFWFAVSLAEPAALHSCPMHGTSVASGHAHGLVSHHAAAPEHGTPTSWPPDER